MEKDMRGHGCNANGEPYSSFYVEHMAVEADVGGPSMTRQEFLDECDINVLMAKYEKTGVLPPPGAEPRFLDVSNVPDLAEALRIVDEATAAFMSLPAKVRAEFENDPVRFVSYAENPDNLERMREWGLAPPVAVPEPPMKVEVINPAPPPEPAA